MENNYKIIYSKRKSISMRIDENLCVVINAPLNMDIAKIYSFAEKNKAWAERRIKTISEKNAAVKLCDETINKNKNEFYEKARAFFCERAEYYAKFTGLYPKDIKVTKAKKRFGSCSGKNSLCFSAYLFFYPQECIDCVVLHEIAHIKYKNHSGNFYSFIEKYMPDYREREKKLKKYKIL